MQNTGLFYQTAGGTDGFGTEIFQNLGCQSSKTTMKKVVPHWATWNTALSMWFSKLRWAIRNLNGIRDTFMVFGSKHAWSKHIKYLFPTKPLLSTMSKTYLLFYNILSSLFAAWLNDKQCIGDRHLTELWDNGRQLFLLKCICFPSIIALRSWFSLIKLEIAYWNVLVRELL